MSLTLLCAYTALAIQQHDRAFFAETLRTIPDDATKAQVVRLLGKPGDIWPTNDSPLYSNSEEETWCYGTEGHHTFPTLGRVVFYKGTVRRTSGANDSPPPSSLIDEKDRRRLLRLMYRKPSELMENRSGALRLIQVANLLRPLGKTKAIAMMTEYDSLVGLDGFYENNWLFWLTRVLFQSTAPKGIFPVPRIGSITPSPPKDLSLWPTYPVIEVQSIPFVIYRTLFLAGFAEPFQSYVDRCQKDWIVRPQKLRPPDDPFPALADLFASPSWPFRKTDGQEFVSESEGLLALVRTAYKSKDDALPYNVWPRKSFEENHRAFLKLGCHWDENRQIYVRRDGSFTLDKEIIHLQHIFEFPKLQGHSINLSCHRKDEKTVDVDYTFSELEPKVSTAIVILWDATTNKQREWARIDNAWMKEEMSAQGERRPGTYAQLLKAPAHKKSEGVTSSGLSAEIPSGHKVKLLIKIRNKTYTTKTFIPQ